MSKPRLLDLFCGAGGAAVGYHRAGFEVVGVDIRPQPRYPFALIEGDALAVLDGVHDQPTGWLHKFDAIHASPPCQAYTSMRHFGKGAGEGAEELVGGTRELLRAVELPYVIENVIGSPLLNPIRLCGTSFGLKLWRHRLFESSAPVMALPCAHWEDGAPIAVYGDHPQTSKERGAYRVRRARSLEEGQAAMGIDWMEWRELTQAIPPAYTEHIGHYLMAELKAKAKAAA